MTDVDKLELLAEGLKGLVSVGEKVMADGKVGFDDVAHAQELFDEAKKVVTAVKAYKELGEEIKDIDPAEALKLLQKILA